jgi:hypothetical protein
MTPPSSPRTGEPRTEADRDWLRWRFGGITTGPAYEDTCRRILAIEREARAGEAEGGVRQLADTIRRHLLMHADHRASDVWQENTVAMFDALLDRAALASPEPDDEEAR